MGPKYNYKNSTFDFIDFDSPGLMGHIENGILESIDLYETDSIIGNIYRGKIIKIVDRLECAFVDIGFITNAYLPRKFIKKHWDDRDVKQGDTVFVEVKKAPIGDKGAVVTMDYSLKEEDIVLLPNSKGLKLSSKIKNDRDRERLLNWGKAQKISGGMILRTSSKNVDLKILESQLKDLQEKEDYLKKERNFLPTPKLLLSKSPLEDFLLNRKSERLVVNNKYIYKKIKENDINGITLDVDFSIRNEAFFRKQFDRIFSQVLYLEDGSNIFIEETEAMTVIDVNTAHAKTFYDFENHAYKTNLSATKEIIRQIKLRNISGMLVIDFLRNEEKEKRDEIIKIFQENFKEDKLRSNIFGFTKMGLFELSRQRKKDLFSREYKKALEKLKNKIIFESE